MSAAAQVCCTALLLPAVRLIGGESANLDFGPPAGQHGCQLTPRVSLKGAGIELAHSLLGWGHNMQILVTSSRMPYALSEIRAFEAGGHNVHAADTFEGAPAINPILYRWCMKQLVWAKRSCDRASRGSPSAMLSVIKKSQAADNLLEKTN